MTHAKFKPVFRATFSKNFLTTWIFTHSLGKFASTLKKERDPN